MTDILVVGITVADFVFKVATLPTKAEKYVAEQATITSGGCAANAAIAISRLGSTAWLVSRVGDDVIGDLILQNLACHSINCSLVQRIKSAHSSFSSITIDPDGERQIVNFRGQNLPDTSYFIGAATPKVQAVLVDTRWEAGAVAALTLARQRGIPGVMDAEPPYCEAASALATHIAFSRQGLTDLTGIADPTKALPLAATRFDAWVCVTDGENGVYHVEHNILKNVPAFGVNAVDTLGAGDVWHGAFTWKLAEGAIEQDAIMFANAVAALKCTRVGGGSVAPDLEEVNRFMYGKNPVV